MNSKSKTMSEEQHGTNYGKLVAKQLGWWLLAIGAILLATAVLVASTPGAAVANVLGSAIAWTAWYLPWSLLACVPFWWFGRRRVSRWYQWDFLVAALPFWVWIAVTMFGGMSKSMSNVLEIFLAAFASGISPLVRVVLGRMLPERAVAVTMLVVLCVAAAAVSCLVPCLPE